MLPVSSIGIVAELKTKRFTVHLRQMAKRSRTMPRPKLLCELAFAEEVCANPTPLSVT